MTEHIDAVGALSRASSVEGAARRGTRWYARYLGVFAVGQLALVPMAVLWHGVTAAITFGITNVLLVGGLSLYAASRRVVSRHFGVLHGSLVGTWAVLFAVTVALSTGPFRDSVPFAAVAALICASPMAVGAWWEVRRSS
ncbi:hypothetical protein [Streptomyces sp. NBC_01508]|uniref:hypothetical protein n=1 Tax=Streptomyces sp. NBC_01508 TaxID=2903888 RepID=UPI00387023EC